jgi:hypothetical protein
MKMKNVDNRAVLVFNGRTWYDLAEGATTHKEMQS